MRKTIKIAAVLMLLGASGLGAFVARREASLDRDWDEDVAVLAAAEVSWDGFVRLSGIRDWRYTEDSVVSREYFNAVYDPADIVDVWMYEQQLDRAGLIAHTFVVFEFDDRYARGQYLGLSVETRREVGEEYSLIGGLLRSFEVTHVWATERDLVTRRVLYLDYPLTRYRLLIPEEIRPRIFVQLARETEALATTPRWYNTATNNCTSSLIRYVNESQPGAIPRHYSSVLTGKVDDHLASLGYLEPGSALSITRAFLAADSLH